MTRPDTETPPAVDKRQRIAKLMARAGLCSRRDAEAWIVAGRVSVNGDVLSSPAVDVSTEDTILVDGALLPALDKTRLFLFHKPRGLVTSDHDPEGRATVADFLREHWPEGPRVVTVGRLDINTEGLLLLTNDGGLARTLELPQTGWVRRYRVRAKGTADPAALDALAEGVHIDGIDYAGIEAKLDRTQGANVWLTMGLREGKNREIKRVLEHMGLEVNRLIRLSFGPFQLLELPEGAVEEVRTRVLRDQLGAKLAAQAGVAFDAAPTAPVQAKQPQAKRPNEKAVKPTPAQPARAERGTRSSGPRPDGRPERRRRPIEAEAPTPHRERPTRGTRKHVSTLRAERSEIERSTPRTRIERSATSDRRDRPVAVERLVRPSTAGPTRSRKHLTHDAPGGRARAGRPVPDDRRREDGAAAKHHTSRGRTRRDPSASDRGRPDDAKRPAGRSAGRRHTSPSAAGKRERVARSGPRRDHAARDGDAAGARKTEHREKPAGRRQGANPAERRHGSKPGAPGDRPKTHRDEGGRPAKGPRGARPDRRPPSGDKRRGPPKRRGPSKTPRR